MSTLSFSFSGTSLAAFGLALSVAACSGGVDVGDRDRDPNARNTSGGDGGAGEGGSTAGDGGGNPAPGSGGDGGGSDAGTDACAQAKQPCGQGQRCDTSGQDPTCVDNTCADLACLDGEDCRPAPQGTGWVCVAAGCSIDADCSADAYCDGTTCRLDVCEAQARTCDGDAVLACDAVGSGDDLLFSCGSGGYFVSECLTDSKGEAACGCEGDWDCPAYTACEVGVCVGTGREPTCTLPPVDFEDVPPALELHWGGDSMAGVAHDGTADANDTPWNTFKHVVATPIVANLDDDNGDGLINELDFPEILFTSHKDNDPWENGILRAVHGGGPGKGKDYFARCGNRLWHEGDPLPVDDCVEGGTDDDPADTADGDSGNPIVVADLDNDGVPEIIYVLEHNVDKFAVLDNRGELLFELEAPFTPGVREGDTVAVANLDFAGYPEIIIGPHVFVLGDDAVSGDLIVTHVFTGDQARGSNAGTGMMACPADLDPGRAGMEIAVGTTLYGLPTIEACAAPPCSGPLNVLWHAPTEDGNDFTGLPTDGFCAVADVWGAATNERPGPGNPPDGKAEVILIADGYLIVLDGLTGALIYDEDLDPDDTDATRKGGAPNVDDFDGDGYAEIATALRYFYRVVDLQAPTAACPAWPTQLPRLPDPGDPSQNPNLPGAARVPGGLDAEGTCGGDGDCADGAACVEGSCKCLHNGWRRGSDDDSSRVTSSSVFDFNGDGEAEVVYNDECYLRVYEGTTGRILYQQDSRSRTGIENPVIADVDNDGNAEIIVSSNNGSGSARCTRTPEENDEGVNGVRVFGDPTDTWVSARRIWNQQSYHVTNVTESGGIPLHEAESWVDLNGRTYNTYRSQPRSYGVAPDLAVTGVSVSAVGGGCAVDLIGEFDTGGDTQVQVSFEVRNLGDLRVGPGVDVALVGLWDDEGLQEPLHADDSGTPLTTEIQNSLEPGASVVLTIEYDVMHNAPGRLPDTIRVIVDSGGEGGNGEARECNEDNNSMDYAPAQDAQQGDLRLVVDGVEGCPDATVSARLFNDGAEVVADVTIAWFAGNPSQGGLRLGSTTVEAEIPTGESMDITDSLVDFPTAGAVTVYGVVDPDRKLADCARGNNTAWSKTQHTCGLVVLE